MSLKYAQFRQMFRVDQNIWTIITVTHSTGYTYYLICQHQLERQLNVSDITHRHITICHCASTRVGTPRHGRYLWICQEVHHKIGRCKSSKANKNLDGNRSQFVNVWGFNEEFGNRIYEMMSVFDLHSFNAYSQFKINAKLFIKHVYPIRGTLNMQ